jgi:hypothetical protein
VSLEDNSIKIFIALLRVGLWGNGNPDIRIDGAMDWQEVYQLAQEQSVQGFVLQGIETVQGSWLKVHGSPLVPKVLLLQWIGEVQVIEQRNKDMNAFIAALIEKLRKRDVYTLLVKGQGVAQCYEKPLWRACGDVDFLLSDTNYKKAKAFLLPLSSSHNPEGKYSKHFVMNIESWVVELHGTLRTGLSGRIDKQVDAVQKDIFYGGNVRSWNYGKTQIFLPSPENDVFLVFTHFLKHFYKEKMNIRQICDWCRLLWKYKKTLNRELLESRIRKAGLMTEWKAFSVLAVDYLGMPAEAMPMYDSSIRWSKKAAQLLNFIMIGKQRDVARDTWAIAKIFPWHTFKFLPAIFFHLNWLKIKERIFG